MNLSLCLGNEEKKSPGSLLAQPREDLLQLNVAEKQKEK